MSQIKFLIAATVVSLMLLGGCVALRQGPPPHLVLITLDTTRADFVGVYGAVEARTPTLDGLARLGTRYARAITASPLTLPAHATLMTGLEPPSHGLMDNGIASLGEDTQTLASVLKERGYLTAAFVSSRVLDRRFGLDRGFDRYDDAMTAENLGEYGYPERDADSVSSAAISWLESLSGKQPFFLWVHYYDPHAPYQPPDPWKGADSAANYAGEIAFVDSEISRLLAALPEDRSRVVAVVGDHGESLGEHGEEGHGIFLYRAVLEVPLILQGQGIPAGAVVDEVVATRRLASTLLGLLGFAEDSLAFGTGLPGLSSLGPGPQPEPVYSSTDLPANAYGWSPLRSLTDQRLKFVAAPKPELYDLVADEKELNNLVETRPRDARNLEGRLLAMEGEAKSRARERSAKSPDPEVLAELRSLGYLSGSRPPDDLRRLIDPKDGLPLLEELRSAKVFLQRGMFTEAAVILRRLVAQNPENLPFLTHLGEAELGLQRVQEALSAYRKAVELSPGLDFPHLNLAEALLRVGLVEEAQSEFEATLRLNRRSARAWLALAEIATRKGDGAGERRLLMEGLQAGTSSALIRCRLGQIEAEAGNGAAADLHFQAATLLSPKWAFPWILWGQAGEAEGRVEEAARRYSAAALAEPSDPAPLLRLGVLRLRLGDSEGARGYLLRVVELDPESPEGREARRLLAAIPSR